MKNMPDSLVAVWESLSRTAGQKREASIFDAQCSQSLPTIDHVDAHMLHQVELRLKNSDRWQPKT